MRQEWFPAAESQAVVGRVVDVEKIHPAMSREKGQAVYIMVPVMEAKVLKDSADVSHQELKPHNREQICARFPGAWDAYMAKKAANARPIEEPEILPPLNGTPIDQAKHIPKEKIAWLKTIGFSTLEQVAEMSDAQVQSFGPGVRGWRTKTRQQLKG